jgi:hypothetical protein
VGKKKRETFPVSHAGNGSKNSKSWSQTPGFMLKSRVGEGGIHMVKDNGSGVAEMADKTGRGHPPKSHSITPTSTQVTETIGVLYNFPYITLYPSKDPCSLFTSQRGKQKQVAPLCLPVSVT